MDLRLLVRKDAEDYELNIGKYSSLFVNYTTNERALIQPLIDFFQPRSKGKNDVRVYDIVNEYEELASSRYHALMFTNDILLEETKLGSKSLLKGQVKQNLLNNVEADGYINNINVLIEDLIEQSISELPVRPRLLTYDSLIKLLEIDLGSDMLGETNHFMHQNKLLLPILNKYLVNNLKQPGIVFFFYPETYLSPKEQTEMHQLLQIFSENIPVFVITKSKQFLSDELIGMNYFIRNNQIFTNEFIEELEWNSPVNYDFSDLENRAVTLFHRFADVLELNPTISNYTDADVVLFTSIDLFVIVSLLFRMKYDFELNVDESSIDAPVYKYIVDIYEKI
ncbi:hypothetical protein [Sediminibacillus albus]|uniref:Uncharacterized protein n=1 Tax=Sediminibacillus albus TaxID=407036 RepID=A0A1G9C5C8_9BACI|nr:hypothetical protein [Sediminibacillus albus]SDK46883.1 hypothetical protein SAMN05216243_3257 [Sediminibacillus albus]